MSRWFRLYDCVLDDPKVQRLAPAVFKTWVNLLCVASRNEGMLPGLTDLAFSLRLSEENMAADLRALVAAGLIDWDGNDYTPHKWAERQFRSDVSTDRVKRFRKRHETVSETPPDTEQIQIQNQIQKEVVAVSAKPPAPPKEVKSKGTRLPADWQPSSEDLSYGQQKGLLPAEVNRAAERFKLWALSASGKNAVKLNWSMAFHNWLLSDAEKLGRSPASSSQPVAEAVPQFQTDEEFQTWWRARAQAAEQKSGAA